MKNKLSVHKIAILVALCGMIAASVGLTTNVAGVFLSPISESLAIGRGSVSLTTTICTFAFSLGGIISGKILNNRNFKLMILIMAVIVAGATMLLSVATNIITLYVLNAVRGIASGLLGTVTASAIINNWFNVNNGLYNSLVMGFSGLAGALLSPLLSGINSSYGWQRGYQISALIMVVLYLPVLFIPLKYSPSDAKTISEKEEPINESVIKTDRNMIMIFIYSIACGFLTAIVQHFPSVSEHYGLSRVVGAAMLSASMIANTAGKLVLGTMIDRFGSKKSIMLVSCAVLTGIILLLFVHSDAAMIAAAVLIGMAYSVATVGVAMFTKDKTDPDNYAEVYSKAAMFVTVTYALGTSLIGYIYDWFHTYVIIFVLMFLCVIIALLSLMRAYNDKLS